MAGRGRRYTASQPAAQSLSDGGPVHLLQQVGERLSAGRPVGLARAEVGQHAVETAAGSLRDLRVAEVTKMDMRVEDGKVAAFRTRVSLSFKYEA